MITIILLFAASSGELNPKKLKEFSEKIGVSTVNLSILKQGKVKAIRFSTLNTICLALDCQPGDILEYVE